MKIEFTLNGNPVAVEAPANMTLLHLLRETLGLTGSKPGCEVGECGACTVILDGREVNSCQLLAPQVHGRAVVTDRVPEGCDVIQGESALLRTTFSFLNRNACNCDDSGQIRPRELKSRSNGIPQPVLGCLDEDIRAR